MRRASVIALAALMGAALLALPASAAKKEKLVDLFWVTPDSAALAAVASIALLPAATYDNVIENEKAVERACAQSLSGSGYRWISGTTSRTLLRSGPGGDSLYKAVRDMILKNARVDSLAAGSVCAFLRVRALLSLRVDNWDLVKMEWDQAGKPSTMLRIRAALVDSLGRLLWTVSGSEYAEGLYHEPLPSAPGSDPLVHGNIGGGESGAPPDPIEVLLRLFVRWAPHFPARAAKS